MSFTFKPIDLFTLHSRSWRTNRYVYPVISRRSKGLSIGVNLNPDKVCNFDCIYCSVDRTTPPTLREVDIQVLRDELDHMLTLAGTGEIWKVAPFDQTPADLRRINDIAFSGDGEPTSFKLFPEACQLAAQLLADRGLFDVKIVVITNATLLHRPTIVRALRFLDHHNGEIWAKLDAGSEAYYRQVERTSIPLSRVMENLKVTGGLRPIVIQSLFINIHDQPPGDAEIDAYIDRLVELREAGCRIKLVQVYTVARNPAETFVTPLSPAQIDAIVEKVRAIGMMCEGYYGPG